MAPPRAEHNGPPPSNMTETPPSADPQPEQGSATPRAFELRGTPVAPGLALGPVHRKDYDLARAHAQRVPRDQVEDELNRFHASLQASKAQLDELRAQLAGKVPEDHLRILDTHVAYLRDSVFLSDVENLILSEQMSLEAAIGKVISDFDRIFHLVENELLRERAVDLRDVGIRVLRNVEGRGAQPGEEPEPAGDYILVARELSIVDMFHLGGREVLGILTEEGGMTSHAAILARSMGIPTLTAIEGLRDSVAEGDFVILDASEGVARVNPDEVVRAQFHEARADLARASRVPEVDSWNPESFHTQDGTSLVVDASCGNLPEVERAMAGGARAVGLYRTELLYLVDKEQPSLDALIAHYGAVLEEAAGAEVTFRLLDVDSSFELHYLHDKREANPSLGSAGVRALLAHEPVLRRQLQALLRSAVEGSRVRIAVPFVVDVSELRRVKEAYFEVKSDLQRARLPISEELRFGVVIETPAAALGARALAEEADFLLVSYDALVQYLLAADREHPLESARFETPHPVVLRTLQSILEAAREAGKACVVTDAGAARPEVLPFLVGAGVRELSVPPVLMGDVQRSLSSFTLEAARDAARRLAECASQADALPLVDVFRRAFEEAATSLPQA